MKTPYSDAPQHALWPRSVALPDPMDVDPVVAAAFPIMAEDRIATAGSCFAQHIARTLVAEGYNYLITEPGPADRQFGVFPARFANIYTVRQLLQTFERAFGLREPEVGPWMRQGRIVDPFRPLVEPAGFDSVAAMEADRARHMAAVREMFEQATVFIFTLGLTEGWRSGGGTVVPVATGVGGAVPAGDETFEYFNASVAEMTADLTAFIDKLRILNPGVKIILTVSPVPLMATYEQRHVLVSTAYSKAALRVVADEVCRARERVAYFPSYEIVTGPHHGHRFLEDDLRNVRPEGVAHVMSLFKRHYLDGSTTAAPEAAPVTARRTAQDREALGAVICEEELIDQ